MSLRSALDDFKRHRGSETNFPGEQRTTDGRFSGLDDRLVHVSPDGRLRDYSYPLVGLHGIDRSRLGIEVDGDNHWFDEADSTQSYHDTTGLIETTHEFGEFAATQYDLTIERTHFTRIDVDDEQRDIRPLAFYSFTPEGTDGNIGKLIHDDTVEIYHDREHDYVGVEPGLSQFTTQIPEDFEELTEETPVDLPRPSPARYEDSRLGGNVLVIADEGSTTFATTLIDRTETDRTEALATLGKEVAAFDDLDAFLTAAEAQAARHLPDGVVDDGVAADLRVISLLSSDTGARIAGPDFDEYFAYSGGYGYTWFRDDAEISRFLLETADVLDIDLETHHHASASFYCETQRPDGTWPHRVWPHNGALAPGWANSRLEGIDGADFQADQLGSVAAFLASYLRTQSPPESERVLDAIRDAVAGLDDTLDDDGLPERCQNAWENMSGRFAHTAATYLQAYSAIARSPVPGDLADHARQRADEVFEAIDEFWVAERGVYALRETRDGLDDRLDSSTLALADAHREYATVGTIGSERLERLDSHVATTLEGLYKDPAGPIEGLVRFEGDSWRTREQEREKIWSVSTAWGANAAAHLHTLFESEEYEARTEYDQRAKELFELVRPGGALCMDTGYLPEQFFDDGTPDSATPLGWPHAIRLATAATLDAIDVSEQPATQTVDD